MTFKDILEAALREIGVLDAGEASAADDALHAMATANRLLDKWAAERMQLHFLTRTVWTIVSGTGVYTVGTGGAVNVARPTFIDHVNFVDTTSSPDTEILLGEPLTDDAWARMIPQKDATGIYPANYHYNPTYPLGTLSLWPVPTSTTLEGVLYAPTAVARFASLATTFDLPPAYEEMLVKCLAINLAPSYERQINRDLREQAREAIAIVKAANRRPRDMSFEAASLIGNRGGGYDIYTDQ